MRQQQQNQSAGEMNGLSPQSDCEARGKQRLLTLLPTTALAATDVTNGSQGYTLAASTGALTANTANQFPTKRIVEFIQTLQIAENGSARRHHGGAEDIRQKGGKAAGGMKTKNIEIVLMDINLGAENGIALTRQINRLYHGVQIVYSTGFMPYCTAVYETEHAYFLTKPVEVQLLAQAMQRAVSRLNCIRPEFVCLHIASGLRRVPLREILYMESEGRKLLVHTGRTAGAWSGAVHSAEYCRKLWWAAQNPTGEGTL
ncbi:MAG: response regulator [Oscillospiraceae bacterium]